MHDLIKSAAATTICVMVAVSFAPTQASAGVVSLANQSRVGSPSPVEQVHYYWHRHYYHHHYTHWRRYHYAHWRHYHRYYGYYPYYNPAAAVVGTAAAVATFPFWGWGYPYY